MLTRDDIGDIFYPRTVVRATLAQGLCLGSLGIIFAMGQVTWFVF